MTSETTIIRSNSIYQLSKDPEKFGSIHRKTYLENEPFPNICFENFFDDHMLSQVLEEFPDLAAEDVIVHNNPREKKYAGKGEKSFGPETRKLMHFLNSEPFLIFLQHLTGIKEKLLGDPYYGGGGLHEIKRGGLLKIHADFNKNPFTGLDRRINVLVYLNKDWEESFGGHFELWSRDMTTCKKKILPIFNTMAIFSTTDYSYHGHPDPLTCPEGRSRKSLALYYYTNGRPADEINPNLGDHTTLFKARAGQIDDIQSLQVKEAVNWRAKIIDLIPPVIVKALRKKKLK